MKKLIAILLAAAMLFAFAACGGKNEEPTTPETTVDLFGDDATDETATPVAGEVTEAPAADDTTAAPAEGTTAAPVEGSTVAASEATTAAESKGLNSTDIAEVVAYYNAAVIKTNKEGAPKGHSTMKLKGDITGDGAIGAILSVLSPAAEKALEKNSVETDYIPGKGLLKPEDVTRAQAVSKNGVTTVTIALKSQTDGSDADSKAGPVGRGIGTLGSIDSALKELGAELTSGRETVKLTYDDAYIKCTINENTGKITGGTWHYVVNIFVGDAKAKLGISANLKNLKAAVDYTVAI